MAEPSRASGPQQPAVVRSRAPERTPGEMSSVAPILTGDSRTRSVIGLRGVVGNQAVTRLIHRRADNNLRTTRDTIHRASFVGAKAAPSSAESAGSACIQRHSAYEHYLLGQVTPAKLAEIPQVREIPDLKKQLATLQAEVKKAKVIKGADMSNVAALERRIAEAEGKKKRSATPSRRR
ncbi:hypothetical protein [Candidatus Amarobacter glycogenicus]|uniref:hypothetical protein n=1 Tax=Candidatus Amarobacter glycogenicus TaxID=3140699 RepID=UPI003136774B|nr:hypothetical protein [Dehalococcoidia bacterium]